jgi:signal transduction histidine kinase
VWDTESNVWASTRAGTIHRFAGATLTRLAAPPDAPVTAMIPAMDGGLWLGTQNGQIWREENGKFNPMPALKNSGNFPVLALFESKKNELWIGFAGGGLTHFANDTAMNWNTRNGLPSDFVAGIVEDKTKKIWLATGAGIYRLNRGNLRETLADSKIPLACEIISEAKTLPDSALILGGTRALFAPDGALWFATSEGVLNVDTHSTESAPAEIPLYLENAVFNNGPPVNLLRDGPWLHAGKNGRPFHAPVDLRSLEIHFTAPSFAAPEEVRFRHKLDGADADWQDDGNVRSARYNRLLFGQYRFRVAAREADGTWQESPQTFSFLVPTPFYFQTWAICAYGFLAVALVAAIVRVVSHRRLRGALARLEQQQSLERERMRIARDMHDEMGSKLTKISFLSERAQVEADAKSPLAGKIESIAQTSRELLKTMDEIVWVVNPHNDTLENLVAYLSHYAVEYFQNTSVECELNLSPQIPHHPLSSEVRHNLFLTFEEILNNVLKHSAATRVQVEMNTPAREFTVKISDNGHGFAVPDLSVMDDQSHGGAGGNGLKNMRQRLASIGGECQISSQPGRGTVITLQIRLN